MHSEMISCHKYVSRDYLVIWRTFFWCALRFNKTIISSVVKELVTMQVRNKQNFWSGVMFIALGLAFAWKSTEYSMGTAARMGPGYFPFWLGIIMAILGAIVLLTSLAKKAAVTEIDKFDFKSVAIITASVVVFALLLQPAGLIISMVVLVLISAAAAHDNNWKVTIANAIFLVILCYLAFIVGLKLVFPIWPAFLGMN
jgi:hypothetical protein